MCLSLHSVNKGIQSINVFSHTTPIPLSVLFFFYSIISLNSFPLTRSTKLEKMNTTTSSNSTKCDPDPMVTAVVLPCLYGILFLVALVLNSLAARIFFNIQTTSTFVVYLKNVVSEFLKRVSGLGFLGVIPFS